MPYLLDSNRFIEAHQRWYGLDFCPGFWAWLEQQNTNGQLFSIDKVREELFDIDDELKAWAQLRGDGFFLPVDVAAQNRYAQIVTWVQSSSVFAQHHVAAFLSKADPWLIAYAAAHGYTIITGEKRVDATSKKVKIPNVCDQFGVACADLVDVIRQSGARLELR
jgi:hypothetical protein